ncbi:MAG: hypothetical protein WC611_10100 [Candidatus Neomarinimicrobiota bacterium]
MIVDGHDVELTSQNPSIGDKTVYWYKIWTVTDNGRSRTLERPGEKIQVSRSIKLNRVVSMVPIVEEKRGRPRKEKEDPKEIPDVSDEKEDDGIF